MENNELFDRVFKLEMQVSFLLPEIIKVLDVIAKGNAASNYLLESMENLAKQLPTTDAGNDPRIAKAVQDAISTIKRGAKTPHNQE